MARSVKTVYDHEPPRVFQDTKIIGNVYIRATRCASYFIDLFPFLSPPSEDPHSAKHRYLQLSNTVTIVGC